MFPALSLLDAIRALLGGLVDLLDREGEFPLRLGANVPVETSGRVVDVAVCVDAHERRTPGTCRKVAFGSSGTSQKLLQRPQAAPCDANETLSGAEVLLGVGARVFCETASPVVEVAVTATGGRMCLHGQSWSEGLRPGFALLPTGIGAVGQTDRHLRRRYI